MRKELLYISNIRGRYKDRITLDNVSFRIYEGEIICVLGYGNAGKSALFKLLGGTSLPGTWDISLYKGEKRVRLGSPAQARKSGIILVGEHPSVFPKISAEWNLYLLSGSRKNLISSRKMRDRFSEIFRKFGLSCSLQKPLEQMDITDQFLIEIIGAYLNRARIILLDCVHYFTSRPDRARLCQVMRVLREEGVTVMYSTSIADEDGEKISDRILLLHEGLKIAELTPEQYSDDLLDRYYREKAMPQVMENLLGDEHEKAFMHLTGTWKGERLDPIPVCRGKLVMIFSRHNTAFEKILAPLHGDNEGDVKLLRAEAGQKPVGGEWLRRHCCIVETLEPDFALFSLQVSALDNICMCMDGAQFLRPGIRSAIKRSNRKLIELADAQNQEDRLTGLTVMRILKQRILLGPYRLCVFVKPERGLDPVETAAVYEEILDILRHEIACIVMTDDEAIFERYKHLEIAHQK